MARHEQTHLVCRISGSLMDEYNPPIVLPNGQVYSQLALLGFIDGDRLRCPITEEEFSVQDQRRAFIA